MRRSYLMDDPMGFGSWFWPWAIMSGNNPGLLPDHFRYLRIKPINTPNISRVPCGRITG